MIPTPARAICWRTVPSLALRRLQLIVGVAVLFLATGTIGYQLIEGWDLLDSLYMTVITVTTVGYMEVHPLSPAGRIFTMLLALGGVFWLFYSATTVIQGIVSGEIRRHLGRQRMERKLAQLQGHMIVCGFGRMGHCVCQEFAALGIPFVIVDRDAALMEGFAMPHGVALHGDATSDEVLKTAGVERARGLVTVAASDAANLFITMSARLLNESLHIVARAEEEGAEKKLVRAGANRVVSPYTIGGQRVAQAMLRPTVMDFLELATRGGHDELQIEEVRLHAGGELSGALVRDTRIRQELGIIIVAIKKPEGRMLFNPPPDARLEADDVLVALGHRDQLDRLETMAERT
jgi:voltage-gated potassium channel